MASSPGSRVPRARVLVDLEVEGFRCLVVRLQLKSETKGPSRSLSAREHETVQMVATGCADKTIASALGISHWTVATHLRRVRAKFGVSSRAAIVAHMLEHDALVSDVRSLKNVSGVHSQPR